MCSPISPALHDEGNASATAQSSALEASGIEVRRTHESVSGDFNGLVNGVFCEAEAFALYIRMLIAAAVMSRVNILHPAQTFL